MSNTTDKSVNEASSNEAILDKPINLDTQLPSFSELLPEQFLPYWQLVQKYPLLEATIIISVFWVFAYLFRRYAVSLVARLASHTESDLDDEIIADLRPAIFSIVIWMGIIIGTRSAGFNQGAAQYITPVALTFMVFSVIRASLSISGKIITALSRDNQRFGKIDVRTEPLLIITSKILILVIGAYITLVIWGINPVGLLASAGIVGIAVGFAAKDTLANLFSGVFILADRPYKLGDYINLDSGERGRVTHIGIRSTRIMTRDDIEITIPNGVIGNAKVVNESGGLQHKMRVRLDVQCAYDADLTEVQEVLMQVASDQEKICSYPAPRVRVRGFADSGINLQLMGWIDEPQDRGRTKHLLYMAIHERFKEHGLEIPYPRRDITLIQSEQTG